MNFIRDFNLLFLKKFYLDDFLDKQKLYIKEVNNFFNQLF